MANDYVEEFRTRAGPGNVKMALNGSDLFIIVLMLAAKQMFTEEIFHDPNVRKFIRELLIGNKSGPSRAGFTVKPTERGLKKIDDGHPYYVYISI